MKKINQDQSKLNFKKFKISKLKMGNLRIVQGGMIFRQGTRPVDPAGSCPSDRASLDCDVVAGNSEFC